MEIIRQGAGAIIRPVGRLDINTSEALRQAVTTTFESGIQTLVIDCQAVTFLDSSGLSAMVMALKKARELHIQLALCSLDEQAMLLFQLTGMNKVFNILENSTSDEPSEQTSRSRLAQSSSHLQKAQSVSSGESSQ